MCENLSLLEFTGFYYKNYCKIKEIGEHYYGTNYLDYCLEKLPEKLLFGELEWTILHLYESGYGQGKCYVYVLILFLRPTKMNQLILKLILNYYLHCYVLEVYVKLWENWPAWWCFCCKIAFVCVHSCYQIQEINRRFHFSLTRQWVETTVWRHYIGEEDCSTY